MKKTFLLFVSAMLFVACSFAQTEQGKFMLGGGLGISFNNQKIEEPISSTQTKITERRTTGITFTPKVGIFITDGFAIGLDADINHTDYKDKDNNTKSSSSYFALGPYARYYFPVNIFLEGGAGFGSGKNYAFAKSKAFTYSFGAGYAAFLNDNVALEPMIKYSSLNFTNSDNKNYKTKDGGLQIMLGLQIYL